MITKVLAVSPIPEESVIDTAVDVLRRGGLVAFPTETVYGLGADALNADAVAEVFKAKGRPSDNPLIVHLASPHQIEEVGRDLSPVAFALAERFWPGPLTLVVFSKGNVPEIVRAGLSTVALRVPDHRVPRELVAKLGRGIVGPSANASGRPSPTTAQHVVHDLNGRIDMILDAGPTMIGVESTVVDVTDRVPVILRAGGVSSEEIESVVGAVRLTFADDIGRRSPGTRHRHYAPSAKVVLFDEGRADKLRELIDRFSDEKKSIGCIVHTPGIMMGRSDRCVMLSSDLEEFAHAFFATIREMDELGIDILLVESVKETGLGRAIMERLRRASQ